MKKTMRLLLVSALLLGMILCSSCANVKLYVQIDSIGGTGDAVNSTAAPAGDTTAAPAGDTTAAPAGDTTAAPAGDTTAAPAGDSSSLSTKEGVVAYYIECYNKIASEGKSAARIYDYTSNYNSILKIGNNSTLQGIASSLMEKFMKENSERLDVAVADVPPVGQATCALTAADLSEATCTDKGSTYEIVLKSKATDDNPEINPSASDVAGKMGPLMETSAVTDAVGSIITFEGLAMKYGTCAVTATVDKATGHITTIDYLFPGILHFDTVKAAVVIKVNDCDIGLLFHQTYEIAY